MLAACLKDHHLHSRHPAVALSILYDKSGCVHYALRVNLFFIDLYAPWNANPPCITTSLVVFLLYHTISRSLFPLATPRLLIQSGCTPEDATVCRGGTTAGVRRIQSCKCFIPFSLALLAPFSRHHSATTICVVQYCVGHGGIAIRGELVNHVIIHFN